MVIERTRFLKVPLIGARIPITRTLDPGHSESVLLLRWEKETKSKPAQVSVINSEIHIKSDDAVFLVRAGAKRGQLFEREAINNLQKSSDIRDMSKKPIKFSWKEGLTLPNRSRR